MQVTGTLLRWNDDRGFGFISPSTGGADIFVHISAFPRGGGRPAVGEKLGYELGQGRDGKPCAVKVVRLSIQAQRRSPAPGARIEKPRRSWLGSVATVAFVIAAGAFGYKEFTESRHRADLASQPATLLSVPDETANTATFSCDGRTHCSQMTSCEEATWFIEHCPGTEMDGNNDGMPCEQQWCTRR